MEAGTQAIAVVRRGPRDARGWPSHGRWHVQVADNEGVVAEFEQGENGFAFSLNRSFG